MIDAEEIISALVRRGAMSEIAAKCARQQIEASKGTPDAAVILELLRELHEGLLRHAFHH